MNELQTTQSQTVQAISAMDAMMNHDIMTHVNNLAQVMATSKVTVPKHLQGSVGDCFAVILQSMQWGMNPFAVAQKTHLVNGVLGYEAQLVNAVITTRAPVTERLQFEWYGDWSKVNGKEDKSSDKGVKVWATLKGETEPRVLDISMAQVGTVRNSPMWQADPRQQLAYLGVKRWARLYCPDVILGVYTPDEFDQPVEKDVTPPQADKPNSGTASLKARISKTKTKTVIDQPVIDLEPFKLAIVEAENIEQLNKVGKDIAALNLGEPKKTDMRNLWNARKAELTAHQIPPSSIDSIIAEFDSAADIEALDAIAASRFEPITAQLTDEQSDALNEAYERRVAELTE